MRSELPIKLKYNFFFLILLSLSPHSSFNVPVKTIILFSNLAETQELLYNNYTNVADSL